MTVSAAIDTLRKLNPFPWHRWVLLILALLLGLSLRLHELNDISLWMDETDWFDHNLYDHMPQSLRKFVALKAQEHTAGPLHILIIALACKLFGGLPMVARMPSVLFGTAAILAIFVLVYRVCRGSLRTRAFVPAIFAAYLTAISITQLEFSQRTFPYGTLTLLTALLVLLHLELVAVFQDENLPLDRFSILAFLYALVAGFAVYIHLSFTLVLFASFLILLFLARRIFSQDRTTRLLVLSISALTVSAIFLAWAGNVIHQTQSPYRSYLASYYHPLDADAIIFLFARAYDLFTYNLTLFYNDALYWPRQLNPAVLPLVVVCILGWVFSGIGKVNRSAKHLSVLALSCLLVTACLSLIQKYPFGGVRQTLFMAPFLFTFVAIGFYVLFSSRLGKATAIAVGVAYLGLWAINLPMFYSDRVTPFTSEELRGVWEQAGGPTIYTFGGGHEFLSYTLHEYPDIDIDPLPYPEVPDNPPYLLISTWWSIEEFLWDPDLHNRIQESGYEAELLMIRPPKYPIDPIYIQSLYFPPNGLWVYRISSRGE
jgi:hypothetical protein